MIKHTLRRTNMVIAILAMGLNIFAVRTVIADGFPLIDFGAAGASQRIAANPLGSSDPTLAASPNGQELNVTIAPGTSQYPGVSILPPGPSWDLSKYGEVSVNVTNTGPSSITIGARVDNAGDWQKGPWDQNIATIAPGQTGNLNVYFGYSFGNPGYALDPSKVIQVLIFMTKPNATATFKVTSITATGKKGDKPDGFIESISPPDGTLVSFAQSPFSETRIVTSGSSAAPSSAGESITFTTPVSPSANASVSFKAPDGAIWDLSNFDEVKFRVKNSGTTSVHLYGRVDNDWPSDTDNSAIADSVVPAGTTATIVVPFAAPKPWDGSDKKSGCRLDSSKVTEVTLASDRSNGNSSVVLLGVSAAVSPTPAMPTWLGKRPPVPGKWTQTLDQNFDTPTLDPKVWVTVDKPVASIWDTESVEVASDAYIDNGILKLKTEKPASMSFDDPTLNSRKYLTSMVTTYSKFTQKYGYFEAKMKLPTGLGMWPAFWLMPDRGPKIADQWERQDTKNGGMEFDILEYLTRFGPFHYNIAMHWDGYQELHQSVGNERNYFHPDKDGFVTAGLLWGPGEVTFFANGNEVAHWKNDRIGNTPEYIMFTQPVGGWGTNGYVDEAKLPQYFQIKYVRVWQLEDWKNIPDGPPLVPTPSTPPAQ